MLKNKKINKLRFKTYKTIKFVNNCIKFIHTVGILENLNSVQLILHEETHILFLNTVVQCFIFETFCFSLKKKKKKKR